MTDGYGTFVRLVEGFSDLTAEGHQVRNRRCGNEEHVFHVVCTKG